MNEQGPSAEDARQTKWWKRSKEERHAIFEERQAKTNADYKRRMDKIEDLKHAPSQMLRAPGKDRTIGKYGPIKLGTHSIHHKGQAETHPLVDVTARLENGEALQRRITATRIVLTGVFALAWRKKKGGDWWLTIEGPDFFWTEKVERKEQDKAREFAAKVNDQARK